MLLPNSKRRRRRPKDTTNMVILRPSCCQCGNVAVKTLPDKQWYCLTCARIRKSSN